jgi:hypothetical protein
MDWVSSTIQNVSKLIPSGAIAFPSSAVIAAITAIIPPAMAIFGTYAKVQLIHECGEGVEKVVTGFAKNPALTLSVTVLISATGVMSFIVHKQLNKLSPPLPISNNASIADKEEYLAAEKRYHEQYRLQMTISTAVVTVVGIVVIGGIVLAYKMSDDQCKIFELELAQNRIRMLESEINADIKRVFNEAAHCGSPSFALAYNDTDTKQKLEYIHNWRLLGGAVRPRVTEIEPKQFKVVHGNMYSFGVGAGMFVRTQGQTHWTDVAHGEQFDLKDRLRLKCK